MGTRNIHLGGEIAAFAFGTKRKVRGYTPQSVSLGFDSRVDATAKRADPAHNP
jgi:hypothetical protein